MWIRAENRVEFVRQARVGLCFIWMPNNLVKLRRQKDANVYSFASFYEFLFLLLFLCMQIWNFDSELTSMIRVLRFKSWESEKKIWKEKSLWKFVGAAHALSMLRHRVTRHTACYRNKKMLAKVNIFIPGAIWMIALFASSRTQSLFARNDGASSFPCRKLVQLLTKPDDT